MSDDTSADRREGARLAAMELQLARSRSDPAYFHGYLMLPLLREGDEVEVEPITWVEARVGDVVTYRDHDKFPTRRIMEIRRHERLLIVMGDSVHPRTSWRVPFDDVIGRVARRRRGNRWMTANHWRWRLQRAKVVIRYRLPHTWIGASFRRMRRTRGRRIA